MKLEQRQWREQSGWGIPVGNLSGEPQLVITFGARRLLEIQSVYHELKSVYPNSDIVLVSTAGEIVGNQIQEDSIVATAVFFEKTRLKVCESTIDSSSESYEVGRQIATKLQGPELKGMLVFSDGQIVHGSDMVLGLNDGNRAGVPIGGGLAGDGTEFQRTLVGVNGIPASGKIVGIGFYGDAFRFAFGSVGGWDPFGPERVVTSSDKNILYELDGKSALGLYKKYLGPLADELPGSALLFPLAIRQQSGEVLVRTVIKIDEDNQSMFFAGEIPKNAKVQLMRANFDRLIEGAARAAESGLKMLDKPELALLISCVGRKLVLSHKAEDEVGEVCRRFKPDTTIAGFYSYGELSPFSNSVGCELHNQTMTVCTFSEC